jgi:hypothetical protein
MRWTVSAGLVRHVTLLFLSFDEIPAPPERDNQKSVFLGKSSAQTRSRTDAQDVFRRSPAEQYGS